MLEFAPAKVNLTLHLTGRRADGYHLLDSLVVFAGVGDRVSAGKADALTLSLGGPFGQGLQAEPDNLVLRAARALRDAAGTQFGAALHLEKNLPIASGIGGGSADAAAALRVLGRLWNVTLPPEALHGLALGLGADVPVCLAAAPARMTGIGEGLTAAPRLPECGLVLINPGEAVATAAVFKARTGGFSQPARLPESWTSARDMAEGLAACGNDLQAPAITLCPAVAGVLKALRAEKTCLLARMSGSGATCFGLFATPEGAQAAASRLARPGWWCWGGPLAPPLYAAPAAA
jgi:4-diphosphocytidyl-2-C-methyl-D-erythritol kinase